MNLDLLTGLLDRAVLVLDWLAVFAHRILADFLELSFSEGWCRC